MPTRFRLPWFTASALALGALSRGSAQTTQPDSPFVPTVGLAVPSADATGEKLQLSGISVLGKKTFVSIYDADKKHSRWLAVGDTADGLEVVSCDVKGDRAVVRVGKELKTLALRPPAISPSSPTPGTAEIMFAQPALALPTAPVAAPQPGAPLTEQAIQEREARMMVSDLLEIGQQQRKAYEEKKAAQDAAAAAAKKDG